MVHCVYRGVTGYNFQQKSIFFSLKIVFVLANSVDPDEMPHYAAFHLGLHCLKSTHYGVSIPVYKGLKTSIHTCRHEEWNSKFST